MKRILPLLLTAFTLSFAACTKSDNNSNSFIPVTLYNKVSYFKGDMNDDKLTLTSFNGYTVSMIYKGRYFTGTALRENAAYNISITDGHTTTTGQIHVATYFYGGRLIMSYLPVYIQFNPGSMFESHSYTLVNGV